jgi:hypothetical protein
MSIAEKIRIIELRHAGKSFDYIAHQLDRSQSTCSRFYDVWTSSGQLQHQLGRPKMRDDVVEQSIEETRADRRSPLRVVGPRVGASRETVRLIRHRQGYHYYDCVPVPRLKRESKGRRVAFAERQIKNNDDLPIIFTDESMVAQDLNLGGIWKQRGEILEDGFYEREHHPISVMVWGAICVDVHGPLICCPNSVNQDS